ncbi:probable multidrug resistance-associated protein lethal(2)03659 [Leptopilina heterotoma]|uniref:probable multidrug resistance-associated protein lethal(2)03659 n=1 Tax=Leptopilina heterotoma TaxID=63436 RepID=UPI001CA960C9|nr:probable multidrug resistance-associated protein lethal(2)03659 [Leptopilina heterotoma]XP_043470126.1 probable multidrug resistance-associated protein lethal(2)03659 [Leptopilina heterotoma]
MYQNRKNNQKNPQEGINLLSSLTFSWVLKYFRDGFKRDLVEEDLFVPLNSHSSHNLGENLDNIWQSEGYFKKKKANFKPSIWRALFKCFGFEVFAIGLLQCFSEICIRLPIPIFLGKMLSYYNGNKNNMPVEEAYYWSTGLILCFFLSGPFFQLGLYKMLILGMKFRVSLCALIYRKLLRTSSSSKTETTAGQIVNYLSNDVMALELILVCFNYLWIGPIKTIIILYLMYTEVELSAVFGVIVLLILVPLQGSVSKYVSKLTLRAASKTDERLRIMNEIIMGIQVIKMYAWEKPFAYLVNKAREQEVKAIRNSVFVDIIVMSFQWYAARIGIFITIVAYVFLGNKITVEKAFMITAFYNELKNCMNIMFTFAMQRLAQSTASIERIRKYLLSDELEKSTDIINNNIDEKYPHDVVLALKNVTAKWATNDTHEVTRSTLNNINFQATSGSLTAVIGQVGSGKSSLLQLIIGELPINQGKLYIDGKFVYVSQEPWIFAASVRQNILFGREMNKARYNDVIRVCQLERDFSLFPDRDQTIIGEKGTTLSGGQRARISLARAVYSEADIYLLDDPLSAVDAHVGRSIFNNCICDYLRGKTRILITHQLQYLQNVDRTYVLNNGFVEMNGTIDDLRKSNSEFLAFLQEHDDNQHQQNFDEPHEQLENVCMKNIISDEEREIVAEQTQTGKVSKRVFIDYFQAGGSCVRKFLVFCFIILLPLLVIVGDYFLTYWITTMEANDLRKELKMKNDSAEGGSTTTDDDDNVWYVWVYTGLILATIVAVYMKYLMFMSMCLKSSKNIHASIFRSISHTTMAFYHNNPSGRIINRFSKDMGIMDKLLPQALNDVSSFFTYMMGVALMTVVINYWMLIPLILSLIFLSLLKEVYWRTSRSVKRLDGTTKSPIFSHLNATIQGITTIRAFKAEDLMIKEFDNNQDVNSSAWILFAACGRAFGYYVEVLCTFYLGIIIYIFLIFKDMSSAGDVALIITQTISMTILVQWCMFQVVEVETNMTSVERILDYNKIPQEPAFDSEEKLKPSKEWPKNGRVEFKNVSLKYSADGAPVLNNLTFVVEPVEKIGIVGRTGAGKSSMIIALFRLAHLEGEIIIDDVSVGTLGLHDLRKKISIIPQEPLLFAGTLRSNLDPFDEYSDDELWQSLAEVELKNYVQEMFSGLYGKVSDGGANFSVGQRQLLCLARAIVRKNKILVLDEATANVDPQTDALIQKTIRSRFKNCTILIVAHRLNTVMDCDRFIVMDAGRIVEFDHPHVLLQNKTGYLHEMVRQCGNEASISLKTIAEVSYQKRKKNN